MKATKLTEKKPEASQQQAELTQIPQAHALQLPGIQTGQTVRAGVTNPGSAPSTNHSLFQPTVQLKQLSPVQLKRNVLALQRLIGNRAVVQLISQQQQTTAIHEHAASGVQGAGSKLPHHDKIQAAFGKYDLSHVQAYTGSQARASSQAIGAEAYATGNQIAFASSTPSLHTVAHEAAHIVQQQAGVQLKGGIGEAGDQYEQHADQVADAVVQGESAESLLETYAGGVVGRTQPMASAVVQGYRLHQVDYESAQSRAVLNFREDQNNWSEKPNAASLQNNSYQEAAFSNGHDYHSEKLLVGGAVLAQTLQEQRGEEGGKFENSAYLAGRYKGLPDKGKTIIYTERQPCSRCDSLLNSALEPDDDVYYTVPLNTTQAMEEALKKEINRYWGDKHAMEVMLEEEQRLEDETGMTIEEIHEQDELADEIRYRTPEIMYYLGQLTNVQRENLADRLFNTVQGWLLDEGVLAQITAEPWSRYKGVDDTPGNFLVWLENELLAASNRSNIYRTPIYRDLMRQLGI